MSTPCNCNCCSEKGQSIESYTYNRNEPKNQPKLILYPNPLIAETYSGRTRENYDPGSEYTYNYAMYKPERHEKLPSTKEEKNFPGVL